MTRDSFIFYRSFYEAISELPEPDQCALLLAICEYSLNFNEPKFTGVSNAVWTLIKPQLDANNKRFNNGSKGGRPSSNKTKQKPKPNQKETKQKPNNNVNDNVNVNNNDIGELVFPFESDRFMDVWTLWLKDRKDRKIKKYTQTGAQAALHKLQEDSQGNEEIAIKMITQSIANGWQGLFPLKSNVKNSKDETWEQWLNRG